MNSDPSCFGWYKVKTERLTAAGPAYFSEVFYFDGEKWRIGDDELPATLKVLSWEPRQ